MAVFRVLQFLCSLLQKKEGQFAYLMVLTFPFYATYTDGELFLGPFLAVYGVSAHFYKTKNTKVHTLE